MGSRSRILLGLAILPALRALSGGIDAVWITVILFVGLLMALRVGPAVLRRVLPYSVRPGICGSGAGTWPSSMNPTSGRNCSGSALACCPTPLSAVGSEAANARSSCFA